MSDEPAPSKKATIVAGVPLRQYVAVIAALGEGFPLETVLRHEGLDATAWPEIDRAWAEALLESADGDLELLEAHDSALLEAQDRFWRKIPPLTEDLGAWLDFSRGVAALPEPLAFLAEAKLRPSDMLRLHRHWSDRIALDPAHRDQALALLAQPPAAMPAVVPEPQKLPPPVVVDGAGTARPKRARSAVAPEPEPEEPPLLAPLPPPPAAAAPAPPPSKAPEALDRGRLLSAMVRGAARVEPPPVSRRDDVASASFPPPAAPPAELQGAKLGLISYASACAEAEVHPERAAAAWAKYGLAGVALEAEHRAWKKQFESFPEERNEFEHHVAHFREHWRSQRA